MKKILGVIIVNEPEFKLHIIGICAKMQHENKRNFRNNQEIKQQEITVRYGLETAVYRALQRWSFVH